MILPDGIVPASLVHAEALADSMADADRLEVEAIGLTPYRAIERCIVGSRDTSFAWEVDGATMCVWGVGAYSALNLDGVPWLLSSRALPTRSCTFARASRAIVNDWKRRYPILRNYVDARHAVAVRWVQWVGFRLLPPIPYGRQGELFHPFEYVRH